MNLTILHANTAPQTGIAQGIGAQAPGQLGTGQTNPFEAGALNRAGSINDFLKSKGTPEAAQLQQIVKMLLQLVKALLDAKGQEGAGGAPAPAANAPAGRAPGHKVAEAHKGGGKHGAKGGEAKAGQLDGPGGFLWKPSSESDGKLVTLLPKELRGKVDSVEVQDANGKTLARGRFAGDDKNGNRPHFRFDRAGKDFGNNVRLVAKMKDGTSKAWKIPNGGGRHD